MGYEWVDVDDHIREVASIALSVFSGTRCWLPTDYVDEFTNEADGRRRWDRAWRHARACLLDESSPGVFFAGYRMTSAEDQGGARRIFLTRQSENLTYHIPEQDLGGIVEGVNPVVRRYSWR